MAVDELWLTQELRDYEKRFEHDHGTTGAVVAGFALVVKTLLWMNERRRHDFIDLGCTIERIKRGDY